MPAQSSEIELPRIPAEVGGIQVNFCKNPSCKNYGVPASSANQSRGRRVRAGNDTYTIVSSHGVHAIKCKLCGELPAQKSNIAIKEETDRISSYLSIKGKEPTCSDKSCENHKVGISAGKHHYKSNGTTKSGSQRYLCKACGKTFSASKSSTLRQRKPHKNALIFSLLMNHSPFKRICEVADIGMWALLKKIDFIHDQCLAFVANRERKLMNGEVSVDKLYLAVDRQVHLVNWTNTNDKRNIMLWAMGSADTKTRYVFGMHLNFDPSADKRQIENEAKNNDDYLKPNAYRRYARLWLQKDYIDARVLNAKRQAKRAGCASLHESITTVYEDLANRNDTEIFENQTNSTKLPSKGMQVHAEYTVYAHFFFLKKLLKHVGKVRFFLDQDTSFRAACLAAFVDEIYERKCDAFYVKITPEMTNHERNKAVAETNKELNRLYDKYQVPEVDLKHELIKEKMREMVTIGQWKDKWFINPIATKSEPEKAVCYLTDFGDYDEDHLARLYAMASLHALDTFFMQARRRVQLLERPLASHTKMEQKWFLYSAYNPERVTKLMDIFRVFYNYVEVSDKDKLTPAMRLGLAKGPVSIEDILYYQKQR